MTEDMAYIPVWMLIFASFGLIIGWALGEELSRRRCAEERVEDLRDQLKHAGAPTLDRQLKEMRSILNDTHKHVLAVSKGLQKPAR
jgi:hypothetical protein